MPAGDNGQTTEVIKPSVGRVVHFVPGRNQKINVNAGQPLAATIAHVWSDHMVNLGVLDYAGRAHHCTSVPLVQPGKRPPEDGYYCCWMDYQLGQAAMTAEISELAGLTTNTPQAPGPPETDAAREPGSPTDAAAEPETPPANADV